MPSHEEGEFELVLGNKQLLSVFFLVILLLAVFFSMGYIVGRNTAPATSLSASNRTPPLVVEPAGGQPPAAMTPDPTKPSASQNPVKPEPAKLEPPKIEPVKPAAVTPPPVTKVETPKPEPAKPVAVAKVEPPKPEPVKPTPLAVPVARAAAGSSYLQVVATKQADAEKLVGSLTQKGFPAKISPVPDSSLVRVLVGPFADPAAIAKSRDGLQAIGFKPIIRKF